MGFTISSTTQDTVWDHTERDQVVRFSSDQYRTAAERFARRVEEFLYDTCSPQFDDTTFLSWAIAVFDREKVSSGGLVQEYDPARVVLDEPETPPVSQPISSASAEVRVPQATLDVAALRVDPLAGEVD